MLIYIANLAYILMLVAFVTRDVLYLRSMLVVAQAIVVVYTWQNGVYLAATWNAVFVAINAGMALLILRERRAVRVPDDLRPLYDRHFSALSPQEFLRWWTEGERVTIANQPLTRTGMRPEWLYFLLKGSVRVSRGSDTVVDLPAGHFVAEMSVLTGQLANADVEASSAVDVVRWPRAVLQEMQSTRPDLWTRVQAVIGLDLIRKIRLWEQLAREEAART